MSKRTYIILLFLIILHGDALAHSPKEGDIWATFGPFYHRTNSANTVVKHSPVLGGAIALEADVDYNGGVEIAMIYEDKLYIRRSKDAVISEQIKRMYITTGYRYWFIPEVSAGLAFFSSYSMGDAKVIADERSAEENAVPTSARDITEYGVDLSIQWELWRRGDFALVADSRYSFSMAKKSREDADLYGLLVGLKYLMPKH